MVYELLVVIKLSKSSFCLSQVYLCNFYLKEDHAKLKDVNNSVPVSLTEDKADHIAIVQLDTVVNRVKKQVQSKKR